MASNDRLTSSIGGFAPGAIASPGTTVRLKSAEAEPVPAVTVALKPYAPPASGVPDSRPSFVNVSPFGNCPPVSDQVLEPDPPVAESVTAYGTVASAIGSAPPFITSGGGGGGGGAGGGGGGPTGSIVITNGELPSPSGPHRSVCRM